MLVASPPGFFLFFFFFSSLFFSLVLLFFFFSFFFLVVFVFSACFLCPFCVCLYFALFCVLLRSPFSFCFLLLSLSFLAPVPPRFRARFSFVVFLFTSCRYSARAQPSELRIMSFVAGRIFFQF